MDKIMQAVLILQIPSCPVIETSKNWAVPSCSVVRSDAQTPNCLIQAPNEIIGDITLRSA